MPHTSIQDKVRSIFSNYLGVHGHRKTKERFRILSEIYTLNRHFDVEFLYSDLVKKGMKISLATVYNTLELLVECDLVARHQFGKKQAQYEKSYAYRQHDHLICEDCGHVEEFCDPRIQQIQSMMGEVLKFKVSHHSLNLYGKCQALGLTGKCQYIKE